MVADGRRVAQLGAMPPEDFADLVERCQPADRYLLLRARFRTRLDEFCRFCWPERFNLPFSKLHYDLFERARRERFDHPDRPTRRIADAAPRGYAKSTTVSFALVIHGIVYDLEAMVVLCAAPGTPSLALKLSRDLRRAFRKQGSRLAQLYGPFSESGVDSSWEVSVRGRESVALEAYSWGTAIRGTKHVGRGIRPTLIVMDDSEHKKRVQNPDRRREWEDFLKADILKAGLPVKGTQFWMVGTVLHQDSMLANRMVDPGWRSRLYKAIVRWPTRTDLWERCRKIWADLTLGDQVRERAARAFYRSHRAEMDQGAELMEGSARDLFSLYVQIWSEGLSSFLKDMQNDPVDPTAQIFVSSTFARFTLDTHPVHGLRVVVEGVEGQRDRTIPVNDLQLSLRWDPAAGNAAGDFAALAVVGRDRWGYRYVLTCWMQVAKPSAQLEACWRIAEFLGVRRAVLESNGFQDLVAEPFLRQREARRKAGEYWQLELVHETTTTNKEGRIASLEPDISNGWLLFADGLPAEVLQQFDSFPSGSHDDGPDAIHGAWADLGGRPPRMAQDR